MTRVYLHTFGCKANQYDTEVVRQALEAAGATIVPAPGEADWAVVNSCAVTHVSEAKMRGLVRRLARINPQLQTVVMGCAAALDDGAIARLPRVAAVVGGADPQGVLRSLRLPAAGDVEPLSTFRRGARAWLKVQDGCDEHCTFCVTTIARGQSRSRPAAELVREARKLAERHAELVLTGVHIGAYGRDVGDAWTLGRLVERLVTSVPRVRFRLSSVEATELGDRLVALMVEAPERLAPHIHAPLQSGSDRVLRRMGRHWYDADSYRERLLGVAERLPRLGLGADVIVGFPGETDADHAATRALIEELPFTYLHVFPYSERSEAPAHRLGPPVDPRVTAERAAELRQLAARKGAGYRAGRSGGRADVVLLRQRAGCWEGLTEDYLAVYVAGERGASRRMDGVLRLDETGSLWLERPSGGEA